MTVSPQTFADRADQIRRDIFGFTSWRGEQSRVIEALAHGKNVLTVMPTGMGKSLCYQIPARVLSSSSSSEAMGLVLVVSPLIALMKDQVDAARLSGLRAAAIHSAMSREQREKVLDQVSGRGSVPGERRLEILYATPERFRQEAFWQALRKGGGVRLLAIDEAHCISTWGHDFRLDYSRLGERRIELGNPQTLALTATATRQTQIDILRELKIPDAELVVSSVWRPNLAIEILPASGIDEKIRAFVMLMHTQQRREAGPAIVYFSLIQTLRKFSEEISRLGFDHSVYHGQLNDRNRRDNQDAFLSGSSDLMLATPAFGLGIDKPNVRLLVHAEPPGSMEAYYQEIGRAGRDGLLSKCVTLFDVDDITIQKEFVKWSAPDPGFIQAVHNLISRNQMRARQEGFDYLRAQMNFYNKRDYRVETAVNLLERWGALEGREPRDWKIVADVPSEYLDNARFVANQKHREEKLSRIMSFFEQPASEATCRLVSLAESFGENLIGKRCGVCDACIAVP